MLSIMEQLQGVTKTTSKPVIPSQRHAFKRMGSHGLLGHEIDEICRNALLEKPGMTDIELHALVEHHELTIGSVQDSLRRLTKAGRAIYVQRVRDEKARYWPETMFVEAAAYDNSFVAGGLEDIIYTFMQPGVIYATRQITEGIDGNTETVLKALKKLVLRGYVEQKGRNKLAMLWRRKEQGVG